MTIFIDHNNNTISPDTVTFNGVSPKSLNVVTVSSTIDSTQVNRYVNLTVSPTTVQANLISNQMISLYNSLSTNCIVSTPPAYYEGNITQSTGFVLSAKSTATLTCITNTEFVMSGRNITILTAPDAPTSVSATAGNAQATVTFTAPTNTGGTTISQYTVTSSGGQIATGASSPIIVTGLTSGGSYTFTVTATSPGGTSIPSAASSSITIWTVPGTPTSVSATAGNAQATVTFTAPTNTGGTTISQYTVTSSGGQTATGASSPITVTGLTSGGSYTFTVTATNPVGTSAASAASSSITVWTVPGAPTSVSAVSVEGGVSVSFTAPTNTGGTTISQYTVTSSGGQTATGASSPIIFTGLTIGNNYTFTVTATNPVGTSAASAASSSITFIDIDPYWSNVTLLIKGEDNTLYDSSQYHRSISASSASATTTYGGKFGSGSIYCNNGYIYLAVDNTLAFSTTFTLEFWVNSFSNTVNFGYVCNNGRSFYITLANGNVYIGNTSSNPIWFSGSLISQNTWNHVALSVNNNSGSCYVNGTQTPSSPASISFGVSSGQTLYFGLDSSYGSLTGLLDEIRITKGVARYSANFTPPTRTFPTQ